MGSHVSRAWRNLRNRRLDMNEEDESVNDSHDSSSDTEEFTLAMVLRLMIQGGHARLVTHSPYEIQSSSESEEEEDMNCCPTAKRRKGEEAENSLGRLCMKHDIYHEVSLCNGELLSSSQSKKKRCNNRNVVASMRQREANYCGYRRKSPFTNGICTSLNSRFIPNNVEHRLTFNEKLFCGTYSEDGNTFLSACQDRHLRIFDTRGKMSTPFKDIIARDVGWSVLDTAFSRDSRHVIYSSWSNFVHLCSVYDGGDQRLAVHRALDLKPDQHNFAVFSLKFSSGGDEVVCGANDGYLYIYDLDQEERTIRINAHEDDVNAVCFADSSSQIIYSGGDDGLVKVWDRRIFSEGEDSRPAGVLAGHQDGITFIDSKGDTRYLISNSKDQSIKLWDIRHFSSSTAVDDVRQMVSQQTWDYRWQNVPKQFRRRSKKRTLAGDSSVQTYTGHRVLNTLIRARFSPMHTTGNKYVYAGCSSGKIFIYDLITGRIISKVKNHQLCVRDVTWHPYEHQLISSSWDGTVAVWGWKSEDDLVQV